VIRQAIRELACVERWASFTNPPTLANAMCGLAVYGSL
jgi:hypothetical protein